MIEVDPRVDLSMKISAGTRICVPIVNFHMNPGIKAESVEVTTSCDMTVRRALMEVSLEVRKISNRLRAYGPLDFVIDDVVYLGHKLEFMVR